ncbi:MAG: DUF4440 domain-containing protein [Ferruginibacter sp.]
MRMQFKIPALLAVSLFAYSACSSPEEKTEATTETAMTTTDSAVDLDKVKVEIQAMEDAYAAGEKAKDVGAVAAYYADDAISYNRNEPPSVGMAAIKEKIGKGFVKDSVNTSVYKVVDLFAQGTTATEVGSWTRMDPAGKQLENGYYMSYFEKRNGKYQCVRDMSVTESPAKKGM